MARKGEFLNRKCSVPGCEKPHLAIGYCTNHRRMFRLYGDPLARPLSGSGLEFINKIALTHEDDACLTWPFGRLSNGYATVRFGESSQLVSRVVCEKTHGPPPTAQHQAAHSCGNGHLACVAKRHLRWATPLENTLEKETHGTMSKGEKIAASKFTEKDVLALRRRIENGETVTALAKEFSVWPSCISKIKNRHHWRHI